WHANPLSMMSALGQSGHTSKIGYRHFDNLSYPLASLVLTHVKLLRTGFEGLERRERVDNFICCHNGIGVVREIDIESGVHLFIRVIRRRVFDHRDLVAKLGGKADGRFDAGMRYQTDDDELMDAVLLEL